VPVFVGIGSNSTAKTLKMLRRLDRFDFPGIISVCPYYNRPSQDGMREHFTQIAAATDRQIVIYNIPYRTGLTSPTTRCWNSPRGRTSSESRIPPAISRNRSSCCAGGRQASR
jgi:hypothetical protein